MMIVALAATWMFVDANGAAIPTASLTSAGKAWVASQCASPDDWVRVVPDDVRAALEPKPGTPVRVLHGPVATESTAGAMTLVGSPFGFCEGPYVDVGYDVGDEGSAIATFPPAGKTRIAVIPVELSIGRIPDVMHGFPPGTLEWLNGPVRAAWNERVHAKQMAAGEIPQSAFIYILQWETDAGDVLVSAEWSAGLGDFDDVPAYGVAIAPKKGALVSASAKGCMGRLVGVHDVDEDGKLDLHLVTHLPESPPLQALCEWDGKKLVPFAWTAPPKRKATPAKKKKKKKRS